MRIPERPAPPPPADATQSAGATGAPPDVLDGDVPTRGERVAGVLAWVNLVYLGVLPAAATFGSLYLYGTKVSPVLVFLAGLLAVAFYLILVLNVAPSPSSPWMAALILVDGPVFGLLSLPRDASPVALAIQTYLIDGLAFGLVLLWAYLQDVLQDRRDGTSDGMAGFIGVVLVIAVVGMIAPFWPYVRAEVLGDWRSLAVALLGLAWTTFGHGREMEPGLSQRDVSGKVTLVWMVGLSFLWIVAMMAGNGLHR